MHYNRLDSQQHVVSSFHLLGDVLPLNCIFLFACAESVDGFLFYSILPIGTFAIVEELYLVLNLDSIVLLTFATSELWSVPCHFYGTLDETLACTVFCAKIWVYDTGVTEGVQRVFYDLARLHVTHLYHDIVFLILVLFSFVLILGFLFLAFSTLLIILFLTLFIVLCLLYFRDFRFRFFFIAHFLCGFDTEELVGALTLILHADIVEHLVVGGAGCSSHLCCVGLAAVHLLHDRLRYHTHGRSQIRYLVDYRIVVHGVVGELSGQQFHNAYAVFILNQSGVTGDDGRLPCQLWRQRIHLGHAQCILFLANGHGG